MRGRLGPREALSRSTAEHTPKLLAEEILEVAVKLSAEDRARLVVRLLDSIAVSDEGSEIAAAQRAESRSRLDAARAGDIDLVDDQDAMRMIAE